MEVYFLNWTVLKDKKWLVFQSASTFSAIIALVLAIDNNTYWALFVALSMLLMFLSLNRAAKIYK